MLFSAESWLTRRSVSMCMPGASTQAWRRRVETPRATSGNRVMGGILLFWLSQKKPPEDHGFRWLSDQPLTGNQLPVWVAVLVVVLLPLPLPSLAAAYARPPATRTRPTPAGVLRPPVAPAAVLPLVPGAVLS